MTSATQLQLRGMSPAHPCCTECAARSCILALLLIAICHTLCGPHATRTHALAYLKLTGNMVLALEEQMMVRKRRERAFTRVHAYAQAYEVPYGLLAWEPTTVPFTSHPRKERCAS